MLDDIKDYEAEIVHEEIKNASDLEKFRLKWLSKKGIVTSMFDRMKEIAVDKKRDWGAKINTVKKLAEERYEAAKEYIEQHQKPKEAGIDLTLEGAPLRIGSLHPLTIIRN